MKFSYNYIEEKAEQILQDNELLKPDFDIRYLAKKLNIEISSADLEDDVSGFFVINNGKPSITYKEGAVETRTRFTIAHEIGHYLLHSRNQPIFVDKTPKVLFRNSASSTGEILKEREANAFAAALLMPKTLLELELQANSSDIDTTIEYLANKFGVSEQAMAFRIVNLGYDIG